MSLFGEKCVRCGKKRTKHSYEGMPTCEPCEELLVARTKAEGEERRTCPLDGATMGKEIVVNLILDRCPSCRGVWLDGGELELLKQGVETQLAAEFARAMVYPV